MATKLQKTIRREIEIEGEAYTVSVAPEGVKLTKKGFRKGPEITWRELLARDASGGGTGGGGGGGGGGGAGGGTQEEPPAPATVF
jgi:hypothetical protein